MPTGMSLPSFGFATSRAGVNRQMGTVTHAPADIHMEPTRPSVRAIVAVRREAQVNR